MSVRVGMFYLRSHHAIRVTIVVEVLCLPYMIHVDESVPVFLESFVWAVKVKALPGLLDVCLVGNSGLIYLLKICVQKPAFSSELHFFVRDRAIFPSCGA